MTDEGYYLHWISNPWLFNFSNSQFGYIYYPLYRLVGENIVLLRQTNMLIMLGLSWIVCFKLLRYTLHDDGTVSDYPSYYLYGVAFAMATCVFSFFGGWWWIPTPSYNSLALESVLIVTIALLDLSMHKGRVAGWILLGFGGWLAFMAKPTTAIALGLLSFFYILFLSIHVKPLKISRLLLSFLLVCVLMLLSAWVIDGSMYDFMMRLRHGVEAQWLLSSGDTFRFLPKFSILPAEPVRLIFMLLTLGSFLATITSTPATHKAQGYYLFFLLVMSLLICTNTYLIPLVPNPWTADVFLAIPLGSWLALMMAYQKFFNNVALKFLILAILFVLLPYAYAIGTWDDIWIIMLRAGFFWILAVVPFLASMKQPLFVRWRMLMTLVVGGQLLTISLVQLGMEHPYRQSQSLRTQTKPLEIMNIKGRSVGELTVSDDDARYIEQLRHMALSHGFSYGDSMIDLSGNYPTALYILGANPVGFPWVAPGFVGSNNFLEFALFQASCTELADAWVLVSLNGRDKYNLKILEPHGINQSSLGIIDGVLNVKYVEKLQLLKPTRSYQESVLVCEKMHAIQKQARNVLKTMLKGTTPTSINILNLSRTWINDRNFNDAIQLLKNAILMDPGNPNLYNNLCFVYASQKNYNDAVRTCTAALKIAPGFQLAKNNRAWIKYEMQKQGLSS